MIIRLLPAQQGWQQAACRKPMLIQAFFEVFLGGPAGLAAGGLQESYVNPSAFFEVLLGGPAGLAAGGGLGGPAFS